MKLEGNSRWYRDDDWGTWVVVDTPWEFPTIVLWRKEDTKVMRVLPEIFRQKFHEDRRQH